METVTIQVKSETAHRWREIARREGRALEAIAAAAAEAGTDALAQAEQEHTRDYSRAVAQRAAAIKRARGSMKDLPGSVDDFIRERSECDSR